MTEYINREQALYELCKNSIPVFAEDGHPSFVGDYLSVLLGIPAADVVEVVRCMSEWISVKDRLPESGEHVLVSCKCGNGAYVCDAFHTDELREVCSFDSDIDAEYDEKTDEYYFPEGWWEVIKNWDEYSCVVIGDFVTHWMPLPEPPKEG